jgi:hypothetical protein
MYTRCVCVCVYIYMYIYVCIHGVCVCVCVCVCIYMYVYIYTVYNGQFMTEKSVYYSLTKDVVISMWRRFCCQT